MATVSRENIGMLNDKLTVTLSKEDYMPAFEQAIKNYAKKATIPGFRKGMVPTGMVKKMYGSGVFTEEVLRTVERELTNYLQNEKLDIFAQPLPLETDVAKLDMNNPAAGYNFAFEIGLKPEVELDMKNITVTLHKVNVTEQMIDQEVERLQTRFEKAVDQEEVTSEENLLNVNFVECDAGGNETEGGITNNNVVSVKNFTEGFRSRLMGMKKDESIVLQLDQALESSEKERLVKDLGLDAGDTGSAEKYFKVTISNISIAEKPQMTEEFFSKVFPAENLVNEDDFRKIVKEQIQSQYDSQSRNQMQDQIYHQLIDHTHIDFPDNFLKRWIQTGQEKVRTAEEAEEEYPSFASSLKWNLITGQLTNEYRINVEMPEIKAFAKHQIMGYMGGQGDDAPWLDTYADSMLKDKKFVENTFYQLQTIKLFNKLEAEVNLVEDVVTAEELAGMQHNHAH